VNGRGSAWTNITDFSIGNGGSFNPLTIEDSGLAYNANGVIGVEEDSANNSVVVGSTTSMLTQQGMRNLLSFIHAEFQPISMDGVLQGLKQIEKRTSVMLKETGFYVNSAGAYGPAISGPITVTPLAAFQVANYNQDAYDEVSTNAIGRSVDSYDHWSYKSILGVTVGSVKTMKNFDFITRVKVSWQHEFNAAIETLDYTLIGGADPHYFSIQAPVQDTFDLGLSFGAIFGDTLEFSLGLDGRYSKEFMTISYNGKIQYSF